MMDGDTVYCRNKNRLSVDDFNKLSLQQKYDYIINNYGVDFKFDIKRNNDFGTQLILSCIFYDIHQSKNQLENNTNPNNNNDNDDDNDAEDTKIHTEYNIIMNVDCKSKVRCESNQYIKTEDLDQRYIWPQFFQNNYDDIVFVGCNGNKCRRYYSFSKTNVWCKDCRGEIENVEFYMNECAKMKQQILLSEIPFNSILEITMDSISIDNIIGNTDIKNPNLLKFLQAKKYFCLLLEEYENYKRYVSDKFLDMEIEKVIIQTKMDYEKNKPIIKEKLQKLQELYQFDNMYEMYEMYDQYY